MKPEVLVWLRELRGMTRQRLGQKLGRSYWSIYRWETGKDPVPAATVSLLAKALGVSQKVLRMEDVEDVRVYLLSKT